MLNFWRYWPIPVAKLLGLSPLLEDFILRKARNVSVHKNYAASLALFSKAIERYPNCARAYHDRAMVGFLMPGERETGNVLADHAEAIRLNPRAASYYTCRAVYYMDRKEYEKAIEDYTQAIRLEPHKLCHRSERGYFFGLKKDYESALADYAECIRLQPGDPEGYFGRGRIYDQKGDHDRAIVDYTEAIDLDPDVPLFFSSRGHAYQKKRQYDLAIADYTEAIRIKPKAPFVYFHLSWRGDAHAGRQEYGHAAADYLDALKLHPGNLGTTIRLLRLLATCSDAEVRGGDKAVELVLGIREWTCWSEPWALDLLAAAYAEAGNFTEAINLQMKALESPEFAKCQPAWKRLKLYQEGKPYRER
jgi:tetratricopeptide (TPR) repeat protein